MRKVLADTSPMGEDLVNRGFNIRDAFGIGEMQIDILTDLLHNSRDAFPGLVDSFNNIQNLLL